MVAGNAGNSPAAGDGCNTCSRREQCSCEFSCDGGAWTETVAAAGRSIVGPLAREPGWEYYDIETSELQRQAGTTFQTESGSGVGYLHMRRTTPIRLVRVYSCWLSGEPPLATFAQQEGVQQAEVKLPPAAVRLPRLLIAICPPALTSVESSPLARLQQNSASCHLPTVNDQYGEPESLPMLRRATSSYLHGCASSLPRPCSFQRATTAERLVAKLQAQVSELSSELNEQRLARRNAEADKVASDAAAAKLREEHEDLVRRVRCAERATMERDMQLRRLTSELTKLKAMQRSQTCRSSANLRCSLGVGFRHSPTCLEDAVAMLAAHELQQLADCAPQDRASMKKRLLLRWHPDKNGGGVGGCSELATRVMQEMQCHPEWSC
mmetsp:Transcript_81274/g.161289  ORF Transcript_81274/g.161289 Transcript_81274/m.161289 type:complete len:381 (-) Transcript_81274:90-1232(-)|eukprot:CAMPEP_0172675088 /NCGR_PEP_ID=MMETSP1074-20121228/13083_1 /TAXON_ID=2916 /ORGANISM="Ceratium fusus, Strain PA161109" /LENGTH=380 /DNA_ID=CAMNT_0013492535 /DNA_START=57 /DNA_END=1199 /DNA_ORIENTATION=+